MAYYVLAAIYIAKRNGTNLRSLSDTNISVHSVPWPDWAWFFMAGAGLLWLLCAILTVSAPPLAAGRAQVPSLGELRRVEQHTEHCRHSWAGSRSPHRSPVVLCHLCSCLPPAQLLGSMEPPAQQPPPLLPGPSSTGGPPAGSAPPAPAARQQQASCMLAETGGCQPVSRRPALPDLHTDHISAADAVRGAAQ